MSGGIYSGENCRLCGKKLEDNRKDAVCCPNHPQIRAKQLRVYFKGASKRNSKGDYQALFKWLSHKRVLEDEGKFDRDDYRREKPHGFANLVEKFLALKKAQGRSKSHLRHLKSDLYKAVDTWGNRNVKEIRYGEIEDFITSLPVADKTKKNIRDSLYGFWNWLFKRRVLSIAEFPHFPEVAYSSALRQTISKSVQEDIVAEVERISRRTNPRIWLAIRWLCTYVNLRPKEILGIKEGHIDLEQGRILIPQPKEKEPKYVYLIREDIEILRKEPRSFPELYFFRHFKRAGSVYPGAHFGDKLLYKWWKRACNNLGIEGVDLYGGTRHSSVMDLRSRHSPETVIRAMGTRSRKAWERYLQKTGSELRPIYEDARSGKKMANDFRHQEKVK